MAFARTQQGLVGVALACGMAIGMGVLGALGAWAGGSLALGVEAGLAVGLALGAVLGPLAGFGILALQRALSRILGGPLDQGTGSC